MDQMLVCTLLVAVMHTFEKPTLAGAAAQDHHGTLVVGTLLENLIGGHYIKCEMSTCICKILFSKKCKHFAWELK